MPAPVDQRKFGSLFVEGQREIGASKHDCPPKVQTNAYLQARESSPPLIDSTEIYSLHTLYLNARTYAKKVLITLPACREVWWRMGTERI